MLGEGCFSLNRLGRIVKVRSRIREQISCGPASLSYISGNAPKPWGAMYLGAGQGSGGHWPVSDLSRVPHGPGWLAAEKGLEDHRKGHRYRSRHHEFVRRRYGWQNA